VRVRLHRARLPRLGQRRLVESQVRRRLGAARIAPGEPIADMEQLARRRHCVELLHRPVAVDGLVAELVDDPRLAEHRLPHRRLEGRLVDERAQVVLIGQMQRAVVLVRPGHRQLQGTPGIEAGRPRSG
jgi:hypothetical protein